MAGNAHRSVAAGHGWFQKDLKIRIILIRITDARCGDYMIWGFLLPPTNGRFGVFF
jgi:hypothetical protein